MFSTPNSSYVEKLDKRKGDLTSIAYKKLKSSVYYDKSRTFLTKRVVDYEKKSFEDLDHKLHVLNEALLSGGDAWEDIKSNILQSIRIACFPKTVKSLGAYEGECDEEEIIFVTQPNEKTACITKTQSFIDMDIEGFILGVVWVLVVGIFIDMGFSDHIKGNRLRKKIREEPSTALTLSPYLYEPYFTQYEAWRDDGLNVAEQHLINQGEGIAIITSDITSFYYSINMQQDDWEKIDKEWCNLCESLREADLLRIIGKRLNGFVEEVIEAYSALFKYNDSRHVLPIGFEPSPILSNLCLSPFDSVIEERIDPLYYGRYVDDLILVINSEARFSQSERSDTKDVKINDLLKYVFGLGEESRFCEIKDASCKEGDILVPNKHMDEKDKNDCKQSWCINRLYIQFEQSCLSLKSSKTSILMLSAGSSRSLLDHFRTKIAANSSLFNLLPDLESLDGREVFEEIYDFDESGSPNKLGNLKEMKLNPFKLSMYLGKCKSVLPAIDEIKKREICEELIESLDYSELVELHTTWQRLFEVMCYSGFDDLAVKLYSNILNAISDLSVRLDSQDPLLNCGVVQRAIQESLCESLIIVLRRTLALCSKKRIESMWKKLSDCSETIIRQVKGKSPILERYAQPFGLAKQDALLSKQEFCESEMVDRYSTALLPSFLFKIRLVNESSRKRLWDVDLYDFDSVKEIIETWADEEENFQKIVIVNDSDKSSDVDSGDQLVDELIMKSFPPYMVSIQEIIFALQIMSLSCAGHDAFDLVASNEKVDALYMFFNYQKASFGEGDDSLTFFSECIGGEPIRGDQAGLTNHKKLIIRKTEEKKKILKVAVSNVRIEANLLEETLIKDKYPFRYYQALCDLVKVARRNKADMLVLPELSMPMRWVPALQRASAKNDLVIVCGLHYYRTGNAVINLTATILPYKQDMYTYACVDLHKKVFFGPDEEAMIRRYGYIPSPGNTFTMYVWKDVYFPVYCCFELASPKERIAFSGYTDVLVAVEWNKDVNYYDHIISSLSRDMSCYCVQANNSIYGDSRIEQPKKTVEKTILKVSGGENWSVQVATLDIEKIRICQMTNDGGKDFKAPAPDLNHAIARDKINGRSPR